MFLASNLKYLRKYRGRTQEEVALSLGMKRPTLGGYENEVAQPGAEELLKFSDYYHIPVDSLLRIDLSQISLLQLKQMELGSDPFIRGTQLRVLTTTVDQNNEENIELVPEKAKAGYRTGFADPDFIKVLPTFSLPFLSRSKKYRSFQISGDSMYPIPDGSWVTGEFVQNFALVRNRHAYIILTIEDGIVFKVAENRIREEGKLILYSLNPLYQPYELPITDVKEIWKFVHYISPELPEPSMPRNELISTVASLKNDVERIKQQMK